MSSSPNTQDFVCFESFNGLLSKRIGMRPGGGDDALIGRGNWGRETTNSYTFNTP